MIKLIQNLLSMFNKNKGMAKKMMDEHGDKIDQLTDKIPGDTDDKMVEKIKDAVK